MKRLAVISVAVFIAVSLLLTAFVFAQEKTIVIEDKKVKKVEEKGAFLGVYMEDLDKDLIADLDYPKSTGVLLTGIVDDSPAEEAGLKENDVVYSFSGEKVEDSKQLAKLVQSKEPGDKVKVVVYREGKKKTFDIALGEKKTAYVTIDIDDYDDMASKAYIKALGKGGNIWVTREGDRFSVLGGRGRLGIKMHELDEDLAPYFKVSAGAGVLILGVIEDSPAEKAGLKAGDILVGIGKEKIEEMDDVFEALDEALEEAGDKEDEGVEVAVTVVRMGEKKTLNVMVEGGYGLNEEFLIKAPQMKHVEMMYEPQIKAYKLHGVEQEKLEAKLKALEKEMEALQEKLQKLEKKD